MALAYRAVTAVKYGKEDGTVVLFAAGEPVTGLSNKAMKDLWDAGALEQYETEEKTMNGEEPVVDDSAAAAEAPEATEAAEEDKGTPKQPEQPEQ
jgi:hypothetical protein